ncbi:MAG: hypothetical protein LBV22_01045 [Mycoplasmataceae bacterium]|nr:hypothetical protein [Mycoplasmataceae bacterium]
MRGKIERILRACINCILVGGALFIVFFALGWVENNEATQLCVGVVVLFLGVIIPSSVKDKAIPSSCDFLVYIQWREKIRNGVKESKNHR